MSGVNYNPYSYSTYSPTFRAQEKAGLDIVTKPIDKVENIVSNTVDTFVPENQNEEKKNSHKTMIRVGSTVLVLSAFVALLNPKFSSALVNKLKTKSTNAGNKAKVDNSIWGKWNKAKEKFFNTVTNTIQILNNGNSIKDELFQKLCNKTSFTRKIHQSITKGFDKISKQTVFGTYKNATKQMNTLDDIMKHYKSRLNEEEKILFEEKLSQIDKLQEYFSPEQTKNRLVHQESLMQDLEKEVTAKIKLAKDTVTAKLKGNKMPDGMKTKDTFKFWAEEALMPKRNKLEEEGENIINALVGNGKTQTGKYQEIIDLLSPYLNQEEKRAFEANVQKADKILRKANKTECVEYFDKKRDLMLGSAPTDVVTAIASLLASGVAISVADTKEDRISRTISGALPVVAGLGVSTALTALLFSGGKGMALGAVSSMILSAIGSTTSHILFPKNKSENLYAKNIDIKTNGSEVKDA